MYIHCLVRCECIYCEHKKAHHSSLMMHMFFSSLVFFRLIRVVLGDHFYGGAITWRPVNASDTVHLKSGDDFSVAYQYSRE